MTEPTLFDMEPLPALEPEPKLSGRRGVAIDITGQKFGHLLAIKRNDSKGNWLFECDCGTTKSIQGSHVRTGKVRSCGCMRDYRTPKGRVAVRKETYDSAPRRWGISSHRCTWCGETKPVGEFARSPKGWVTNECRSCETERLECWARVEASPPVTGRRYVNEGATQLMCRRCGRERPKSLFYTYKDARSDRRFYRPRCKQCTHADANSYNVGHARSEEGRKKDRDRWLRRNYGITLAEYEFLFARQDGRCGLCGTTEPGGPTPESAFHVDHDHATKRVRGLLCRACNTAIGLLKEDPDLLMKAVAYLRNGGVFEPVDDAGDFALATTGDRFPACLRFQPYDPNGEN